MKLKVNEKDSFQVATSIHEPLNDGRSCRALMNSETSSSSSLDSVEFSLDPAVCVSYQISPLSLLSMSAQYGAATNEPGLLSLENGTGINDVKAVPNDTSPFVATCVVSRNRLIIVHHF